MPLTATNPFAKTSRNLIAFWRGLTDWCVRNCATTATLIWGKTSAFWGKTRSTRFFPSWAMTSDTPSMGKYSNYSKYKSTGALLLWTSGNSSASYRDFLHRYRKSIRLRFLSPKKLSTTTCNLSSVKRRPTHYKNTSTRLDSARATFYSHQ